MFDADRDADQTVRDTGLRELLFGESGVRSGFGVAGERLDTAERDGVHGDFQVAQEFEGRGLAALQLD